MDFTQEVNVNFKKSIALITASIKAIDSTLAKVKLKISSLNTKAMLKKPSIELNNTLIRIFDFKNIAPLNIFRKIIVEKTTATHPLLNEFPQGKPANNLQKTVMFQSAP